MSWLGRLGDVSVAPTVPDDAIKPGDTVVWVFAGRTSVGHVLSQLDDIWVVRLVGGRGVRPVPPDEIRHATQAEIGQAQLDQLVGGGL